MIDLYLRAETEADMLKALRAAGLVHSGNHDNGETLERIDGAPLTSIAVLGALREQTGTQTVNGEDVPTFSPIPGWHVNVRTRSLTVADTLRHLNVKPNSPACTWAGEPPTQE